VRLTNPSRTVTVASPDWGFAHQGEEIEAAVDGILTANESSLLVRAALDGIWIAYHRRDGRDPADVDPNGSGSQIARGIADLWRQEICRSLVLYSGPGGPLF